MSDYQNCKIPGSQFMNFPIYYAVHANVNRDYYSYILLWGAGGGRGVGEGVESFEQCVKSHRNSLWL